MDNHFAWIEIEWCKLKNGCGSANPVVGKHQSREDIRFGDVDKAQFSWRSV